MFYNKRKTIGVFLNRTGIPAGAQQIADRDGKTMRL